MLKKRGYNMSESENIIIDSPLNSDISYNKFKSMYYPIDKKVFLQDNLSKIYSHSSGSLEKMINVIFVREEDESKKYILTDTTNTIKSIINRNSDIKNIILIVRVDFRSANLNDLLSLVQIVLITRRLNYIAQTQEFKEHKIITKVTLGEYEKKETKKS